MKSFIKNMFRTSLAVFTFLSQAVLANAAETNFWKDRQLAALPLPLTSPLTFTPQQPQNIAAVLNRMNPSLGSFDNPIEQARHRKKGQKLVIHVQDVHTNLEAQKNVGGLVSALVLKADVRLIGLEGASGVIDLQPLMALDEAVRVKVADSFLEQLEIGGPMHHALTASTSKAAFVGVEDSTLFLKNWDVVKDVKSSAAALRKILQAQTAELEGEKERVFNASLRTFDRSVGEFRDHRLALGDFVTVLARHGAAARPQMSRYTQAQALEKKFSTDSLQRKRDAFVQRLAFGINDKQRAALVESAQAMTTGRLSQGEFLSTLSSLASKSGVAVPGEVSDYARYLNLSESLNPQILLAELERAEDEVYARLAHSPLEKRLLEKTRDRHLVQKLVDFSLTPQEWDRYVEKYRDNTDLRRFKPAFEAFYEIARQRDQAIAARLLAAMNGRGEECAVLVTGGFHSTGIHDALRAKNVQIVTVSPRFDVVDAVSGSSALFATAGRTAVFDGLFPGGNVFLPQPTWTPTLHSAFVLSALTTTGVKTSVGAANRALRPLGQKVWLALKRGLLVGTANGFFFYSAGDKPGLDAPVTPLVRKAGNGWAGLLPTISGPVIARFATALAALVAIPSVAFAQAGGITATGMTFSRNFDPLSWGFIVLGSYIASIVMSRIYVATHSSDDFDKEYPDVHRLLGPLITFIFLLLQWKMWVGIPLMGLAILFRWRTMVPGKVDHTSLIFVVVVGFAAGVTTTLDTWLIVLLPILAYGLISSANYLEFLYGKTRGPDCSIQINYIAKGPDANPEADFALLNSLLDKYLRTKSDDTSVTDTTTLFEANLKDPTGADPLLGGIDMFQLTLSAMLKGKFSIKVTNLRQARVTFASGFVPPLLGLGLLASGGQAVAQEAGNVAAPATGAARAVDYLTGQDILLAFAVLAGLLSFAYVSVSWRSKIAARSESDKFRKELRAYVGSKNASETLSAATMARILAGPRPTTRKWFRHKMLGNIHELIIGLGLGLFLASFAWGNALVSTTVRADGEAIPVDDIDLVSPIPGDFVLYVRELSRVRAGDLIAVVFPKGEKAFGAEIDALRKSFEAKNAQLIVDQGRVLQDQRRNLISLSSAQFTLMAQEAQLERDKVLLGYELGFLERERSVDAKGATSRQAVETAEARVKTLETLIRNLRDSIATAKAELKKIEAELRSAVPGEFKQYQDLLEANNAWLEAEILKFHVTNAPVEIRAPFSGAVRDLLRRSNRVQATIPFARIISELPPQRIVLWAREGSQSPAEGDVIILKNSAGVTVEAPVTWTLNFAAGVPADVDAALTAQLPRPGRMSGLARNGQPFIITLPAGFPYTPGETIHGIKKGSAFDVSVFLGLKPSPAPQAALPAAAQAVQPALGSLVGRRVTAPVAATRATFGPSFLSEISAATTRNGLMYVGDDGAEVIDVLDVDTLAFRERIDLSYSANAETRKEGKLDVEAFADAPNGLAVLLESQLEVRVYDVTAGVPEGKFQTFKMRDKRLKHAEGLVRHPVDGRYFLAANAGNKTPTLYQVELDNLKGDVRIVREFDLSRSNMGPVRDLTFYTFADRPMAPVLLLLESDETRMAIHQMDMTNPQEARMLKETIAIPRDQNLFQPEALAVRPKDGSIVVFFETKRDDQAQTKAGRPLRANNMLILQVEPVAPEPKAVPAKQGAQLLEDRVEELRQVPVVRRKMSPGLYARWAPLLQRFPQQAPFIAAVGGAVEGTLPALTATAASLLGAPSPAVLSFIGAWIVLNGAFKYVDGFVAFDAAGPTAKTGRDDFNGWLLSNLTSWTSLLFVVGLVTATPWPIWAILFSAWVIHAPVNFAMAWWTGSLLRALSDIRRGSVVLITVREASFAKDVDALRTLTRAIGKNPALQHLQPVVAYFGNNPESLAGVRAAAGSALVLEGPESEGDVYRLERIFDLADMKLNTMPGQEALKTQIADLANPDGSARFALVSSQADLFVGLENRRMVLSMLLGLWSIDNAPNLTQRLMGALLTLKHA